MRAVAINNTGAQASGGRFPRDLAVWTEKKTLASLVQEAVQIFYWGTTLIPAGDKNARAQVPEVLLGVLTFCYASGVYATPHILQLIDTDMLTNSLSRQAVLDEKTIRLFRGQNRELLTRCLAYVFQHTWARRSEEIDGTLETGRGHRPGPLGPAWEREIFVLEAESRIEQAVEADRTLYLKSAEPLISARI